MSSKRDDDMVGERSVAILSRATAPLGATLAQGLLEAGYAVALVDEDLAAAQSLASDLDPGGTVVVPFTTTLTERGVKELTSRICATCGEPQALVTCPPRAMGGASLSLSASEISQTLEQIVLHAFLWSWALGNHVQNRHPAVVVHVTELSGLGGWPGWLAQSVSYGAIHNLVHTLAAEWASSEIRVNALVAGMTEQVARDIVYVSGMEGDDEVRKRVPVETYMSADDLVAALQYLIDPAASYVSGEILRVDGGWDSWGRLYATAGGSKT